MSSQPNEKGPGLPDALVRELLSSQGLPADSRVTLNVHTTRVRVNPDGTRTILSESDGRSATTSRRRAPRWAGVLFSVIGFAQMAYGLWASHSDSMATPLLRQSASCQIAQLAPSSGAEASGETIPVCRVEKAVVVRRHTTTSRRRTRYYIETVTPIGKHDDIPVVGWKGSQLWSRVQPTERIAIQRFVRPGFHLTGDVIALGDDAGSALSQSHPDSGAQNNLVNILMGAVLFVTGLVTFARAPEAT